MLWDFMTTTREPIARYSHPKLVVKFVVIVGFCALLWAFLPVILNSQGHRYPTELGNFVYITVLAVFSLISVSVIGACICAIVRRPPVFISDGKLYYFKWFPRSIDLEQLREAACGRRVSVLGHKVNITVNNGAGVSFDSSVIVEHAKTVVDRVNVLLSARPDYRKSGFSC